MDAGTIITLVSAIGGALVTLGTGVAVIWRLGGAWGKMVEHMRHNDEHIACISARVDSLDTRVHDVELVVGTVKPPVLKMGGM